MLSGLVYGLAFFLLICCFPGPSGADFFFAVCSGVGVLWPSHFFLGELEHVPPKDDNRDGHSNMCVSNSSL